MFLLALLHRTDLTGQQ